MSILMPTLEHLKNIFVFPYYISWVNFELKFGIRCVNDVQTDYKYTNLLGGKLA